MTDLTTESKLLVFNGIFFGALSFALTMSFKSKFAILIGANVIPTSISELAGITPPLKSSLKEFVIYCYVSACS